MIRKLFGYNSYTLFWQKIRFEIFGRLRGGYPKVIFSDFGDKKKKKKVVANGLRMVQFSEKINKKKLTRNLTSVTLVTLVTFSRKGP